MESNSIKTSKVSNSTFNSKSNNGNTYNTSAQNDTQSQKSYTDLLQKTVDSLSDEEKEFNKMMNDIKNFSKAQQVAIDNYKDYLLIETKCRKIYLNIMRGRIVLKRDKYFLLKNKPELYGISKAMGKKPEKSIRADKIIKHYGQIGDDIDVSLEHHKTELLV